MQKVSGTTFTQIGYMPVQDGENFTQMAQGKKWKPSAAKLREWARVATNPGKASFLCPTCHESFILGYGKFIQSWRGDQFVCRACAKR